MELCPYCDRFEGVATGHGAVLEALTKTNNLIVYTCLNCREQWCRELPGLVMGVRIVSIEEDD
jgi:hypothetical protein